MYFDPQSIDLNFLLNKLYKFHRNIYFTSSTCNKFIIDVFFIFAVKVRRKLTKCLLKSDSLH